MRFFTVLHFVRIVPGIICMLALVVVSPFIFALAFVGEWHREQVTRRLYGADWRIHYELLYGSLAKAQTRMVLCAIGIVVVPSLFIWIYKLVRGRPSLQKTRRRRHRVGNRPSTAPLN